MEWIRYDIHTNTKDAGVIGDILAECNIAGYEISDHVPLSKKDEQRMYTGIPADPGPDDGSSVLTFYTEAPNNSKKEFFSTGSSLRDDGMADTSPICEPEELIASILEKIKNMQAYYPLQIPKISYCIQDDSLWKNKWKENFKAFYVTDNIIVKPSWEEAPKDTKPNDIIIDIDPGSAFGTGTHETTKLCLLSLRKYITPETTIIDAGCGSGILAITALLCGAKSAFCIDIDPAAVSGTMENASRNHIDSSRITAVHADILKNSRHVRRECGGTFQIAVANILADVIVKLSDYIGDFINKDGIFISSGILDEKALEVEQALLKNHFTIIERNTLGEWVSFVAKKGNA